VGAVKIEPFEGSRPGWSHLCRFNGCERCGGIGNCSYRACWVGQQGGTEAKRSCPMVLRATPERVIGAIQRDQGRDWPGRAGGHGVSVGGDSDSCGTAEGLRRSAEQKPRCGDAFDEMHSSAARGAAPQWC